MTVTDKNPFKVNDYVLFKDVRKLPLQRSDRRGENKTNITVKGVVTAVHGEKLTIDISNTIPYSAKKHYEKTCEASYTLCEPDPEP
jgi:hypothetical protein